MKKIFTLLTLALCVLGMNAETVIDMSAYSWSSWDSTPTSSYDATTCTLTFDAAWKGGQFTIDPTVNATDAEYLLFQFDTSSVAANVTIKGFWDSGFSAGTTYNGGSEYCYLEVTDAWKAGQYRIQQIQFQAKNDAGKIIIKKAALCSEKEMIALGLIDKTPKKEIAMTICSDGPHIKSEEFDSYDDATKVKIVFTNVTSPYESRNGWGIGQFSNIDNWDGNDYSFTFTGGDGETFSSECTVGDMKKAAKNGGDEYVTSEYSRTGVTFNIYNGCVLTAAYAIVPTTTITAPGDQKYFSYITESALDFEGTGLKAYIATSIGSSAVTVSEVTKVPAETALILLDDGQTSYNVPQIASAELSEENILMFGISDAPANTYCLNADGNFQLVQEGLTIPDGKVCIITDSAAKETLGITLDSATSIANVNAAAPATVRKAMKNGRIVIDNGGAEYTISGARLK